MKNPFKFRRNNSGFAYFISGGNDDICIPGYTTLDQNPEVMTACRRIAELIGSMTIHLMNNTEKGDVRIQNELSKLIDVNPMPNMVRANWVQTIVMDMLLYGRGNAVVKPHTRGGLLEKLEPIPAMKATFVPYGDSDYKILLDGKQYDPSELLHFVFNPDKWHPWKGVGVYVSLQEVANNLKQAAGTKKSFLESKWKPSIIIGVDALNKSMASEEGREKILESYIKTDGEGKPWIIPADQMDIQTIKPLTLKDLALSDSVELDKRTIASIMGVPPFVLGVGEYNQQAWNSFIQNTVRVIAQIIAQELTKKLILSPNWYLKFNALSLMDWDLQTVSTVYGSLSDRGYINGNEVRDKIGMSPVEGLDEFRVLENYIPIEMSGNQKKLNPKEEGGENE